MASINNDKYYTPSDTAEYVLDTTLSVLESAGLRIDHIIEPSAGGGVFIPFIKSASEIRSIEAPWFFDIEPEHPEIELADWLTVDVPYWQNRLIIGNPPFGTGINGRLLTQFINCTCGRCDYVSFILPIQNLNKSSKLWISNKMELIHSEDLGILSYSDVDVHCCFNIYVRNNITLKHTIKPEYIKRIEKNSSKKEDILDIAYSFCSWGTLFKTSSTKQYSQEILITKDIYKYVLATEILNYIETGAKDDYMNSKANGLTIRTMSVTDFVNLLLNKFGDDIYKLKETL